MKGRNGTIKHRTLKKGVYYKIPCKRVDGQEDFITIVVRYSERCKTDVAFVGNLFMGAHLQKVWDDVTWFKIDE